MVAIVIPHQSGKLYSVFTSALLMLLPVVIAVARLHYEFFLLGDD